MPLVASSIKERVTSAEPVGREWTHEYRCSTMAAARPVLQSTRTVAPPKLTSRLSVRSVSET